MSADNTIQNDIAYLRGLAEAGRKGPILGGSILFASGLIYSLTGVASWAIYSGRVDIDLPFRGLEWWLGGLLQIAVIIVMSRRLRHLKGAATSNSKLFGAIWSSLGSSIGVVLLAMALANIRFRSEMVFVCMPAVVFGAYGAGWMICAAIMKRRWMYAMAVTCYLTAALTPYLVASIDGLLTYSAVIFITIGIPGLLLMREASTGESVA